MRPIRAARLQVKLLALYGVRPVRAELIPKVELLAEDETMSTNVNANDAGLDGVAASTVGRALSAEGGLLPKDKPVTKRDTPRRINRLDSGQMYKLARWFEAVLPALDPGVSRAEVATQAMASLGFTVTIFNIDGILEMTGLKLPVAVIPATLDARIAALEAQVLVLSQLLLVLTDEIPLLAGKTPEAAFRQIRDYVTTRGEVF